MSVEALAGFSLEELFFLAARTNASKISLLCSLTSDLQNCEFL